MDSTGPEAAHGNSTPKFYPIPIPPRKYTMTTPERSSDQPPPPYNSFEETSELVPTHTNSIAPYVNSQAVTSQQPPVCVPQNLDTEADPYSEHEGPPPSYDSLSLHEHPLPRSPPTVQYKPYQDRYMLYQSNWQGEVVQQSTPHLPVGMNQQGEVDRRLPIRTSSGTNKGVNQFHVAICLLPFIIMCFDIGALLCLLPALILAHKAEQSREHNSHKAHKYHKFAKICNFFAVAHLLLYIFGLVTMTLMLVLVTRVFGR